MQRTPFGNGSPPRRSFYRIHPAFRRAPQFAGWSMQKSKERWVSIPEIVFTDYELPEGARLLYGEVNALSRREGRCWASNAHFASRLGKSRATISRWIDSLVKRGHIRRVLVDKGNGDFARHLIPTVTAGDGLSTKGDTRNATPVVTGTRRGIVASDKGACR